MEPYWEPLQEKLGEKRCAGFMFMGRINGINLYKHGIARMYLNLDDWGHCYVSYGSGSFARADFATELAKLKTALRDLGETLENAYDETYYSEKARSITESRDSAHELRDRTREPVHQLELYRVHRPSAFRPIALCWRSLVD